MIDFIFFTLIILILYPLAIYPASLMLLNRFVSKDVVNKSYNYKPRISLIVTAYNEENVILQKMQNILAMKQPFDNVEVIVVSDSSTDETDKIVAKFCNAHSNAKMTFNLLTVAGRKGKTNAQNIAVRKATGDVIVFSDANSIWLKNALVELVSYFNDEKVGYVSGKLAYTNSDINSTSETESSYWNLDLKIRQMESNIGSTVGGNGAIYAIRTSAYVELPALLSHDGFMPTKVVLQGLKAKFCPTAIAYEKSGENTQDEFGRKVRMQRGQPWKKYYDVEKYNIFKYGLFSYFYIGHKYVKYLLYVTHPLALILNVYLAISSIFYTFLLLPHSLFYLLGTLGWVSNSKNKLLYFPYYYLMTIVAQCVAVKNTLTGKAKAVWEKAESTRK